MRGSDELDLPASAPVAVTRYPPLSVASAAGHRHDVDVDGAATVGELAAHLGLDGDRPVTIDGRAVDRRVMLDRSGIRHGSVVATVADGGHGAGADVGVTSPAVEVSTEAGPSSGRRWRLPAGRHTVGRSRSADISIDDPAVELHHAVLIVDVAGSTVSFTLAQLAGRSPLRIDHAGGDDGSPPRRQTALIGNSRLAVTACSERCHDRDADSTVATVRQRTGDPWRREVCRPPRRVPRWDPPPLDVPRSDVAVKPLPASLATALISAVGAAAMAWVFGSWRFAMFGVIALVGALVMRLLGRRSNRRRRRLARRVAGRDLDAFAKRLDVQRRGFIDHHRTIAEPLAQTVATIEPPSARLWARRPSHGDAFSTVLGWGSVDVPLVIAAAPPSAGDDELADEVAAAISAAGRADDLTVTCDLGPNGVVAVSGDGAAAVVRSLLLQLAAHTGPADWQVLVIADDPDEWAWCGWLPHAASGGVCGADDGDQVAAQVGHAAGHRRHTVVVIDRPDLLAARTGGVRRLLRSLPSVTIVVIADQPPSICTATLDIGSIGRGRWVADVDSGAVTAVHVAGVTVADATRLARRLASLHDPEIDADGNSGELPSAVSLSDLAAVTGQLAIDDAAAIAAGWRRTSARRELCVDLGVAADGVVAVDLVADGPHALVGGTTGSGKSALLRSLVIGLAARYSPADVSFLLVDYKGGATFDACSALPHTVGVVTDLDAELGERALASLRAELRGREELLRRHGATAFDELATDTDEDGTDDPPIPPRLVVVIDEFAELAHELPDFLQSLVGIARLGRSLGVHLVLATQRPAGVISDEIRANTALRIALRLVDRADALDVVGDDVPATFSRRTPGRTRVRLGPGEAVSFQAATGDVPPRRRRGPAVRDAEPAGAVTADTTELSLLGESIAAAATLAGIAPPRRPWVAPLPAELPAGELPRWLDAGDDARRTLGVIDVPERQGRRPLHWEPADGHLLLVGARGSGTTSTLQQIAAACGQAGYVIDADGGRRWRAGGSIVAAVRLGDSERRDRMIGRLAARLTASGPFTVDGDDNGHAAEPTLLVVDDLAAVLAELDRPATATVRESLLRLLTDGPSVGVAVVASIRRPGALSATVLSAFAVRWLFHLRDPAEGAALGVRPAAVPPAIAGRIRLVASGHSAQIVAPTDATEPLPSASAGEDHDIVGTLPHVVAWRELPDGSHVGGDMALPVGIDFVTLEPAVVDVPDGEHVLIAGPPRSGRSSALTVLAAAWREAWPDGELIVYSRRRATSLTQWAESVDAAILDDARALDDHVAALLDAAPRRRTAFVIDDAERVADDDHRLLDLAASRVSGVVLFAAGRPDAIRLQFGHWTAVIRRSRLGAVLTGGADTDFEVFGELPVRHPPLSPRPGLAWTYDLTGRHLVQWATIATPATI